MAGVSVRVKGTNDGAVTDMKGNYSVTAATNGTLIFSFVGYMTQEVSINGRTRINVNLSADARIVDEVQVVAYGLQEKRTITGAQGGVTGAEIANLPVASIQGALQGKVAGLQSVAFSGQPGAFQSVRVRGIGSINASSEPLYVIDGVPVNANDFSRLSTSANSLAGLNPSDIENVTVLKDAASASIYGSRAANGVILITTKKGRAGSSKTTFMFDSNMGTNSLDVPDAAKPLTRDQYLELTKEGLVNSGATAAQQSSILTSLGEGTTNNTDWLDLVTRKGQQRQYNLSAAGGDNKTNFYTSLGYYQQEAVVIGSAFDRISAALNVRHNATERVSFNAKLNMAKNSQQAPANGGAFANPVLSAYFLLPTRAAFNADGTSNYSLTEFPSIYNPVAYVEYQKRNLDNTQTFGSMGTEIRPLSNLTLSSTFGFDYNVAEELRYDNPFFGDGRTAGGRGFAYYTRFLNWNWVNMADYRQHLSNDKKTYLDVKAGYELQTSKQYNITAQSDGYPPNTDLIYPIVAASPKQGSSSGSDYAFQAIFGRTVFNYKSLVSVEASLRRDGSSRFGANNRYGVFWASGLAINVDQFDFMKNLSFISFAKLRASYGTNGNGGIGNYAWRPTYGYGANYNQQPGSLPTNVGNENLTWEINKPFNVGLDLGFWQDRLSIVADYYVRKTEALLLDVPISRTTGFASFSDNIGSMENRGLELAIQGTPIKGDFTWTSNFNITYNQNKITGLAKDNTGKDQDILSGSFIRRVGYDFQTFYVRQWAGVDPQTGAPLWYTDDTKSATTSTYNTAQRVLFGSASPKYFGAFSNTLSYKGFSVSALANFVFGNYVRDIWARYTLSDGWNPGFNKIQKQLDRWQKPGDVTDVPKYVYNNTTNSQEFSTRFLFKGDFIRLREVSAGYEIPRELLRQIRVNGLRIYAQGTNLFTKTFDENLYFDPENGVTGENNFNIFLNKSVTFGVTLSL